MSLENDIKEQAYRLGFSLAGITSPTPPPHFSNFENWLSQGFHGSMHYLESPRARSLRSDPCLILPECKSILVLAIPYQPSAQNHEESPGKGNIAAYAWGDDYHEVLPKKLKLLVAFIEKQVGHIIPNRWYTDTGPILERDLAQRAGLGWIGKNTCLINPAQGSLLLLAEILLGIELEPDQPFQTDHCGTCTRCLRACPTRCILPNRTLDARRCISYLTIELKDDIPEDLRPLIGNWIFGCDICQDVCPWNRFAPQDVNASFAPRPDMPHPHLLHDLTLSPQAFNRKFKNSPVKRAKRRGYLRNIAVALGNSHNTGAISALKQFLGDPEPLVREHAAWAIEEINRFSRQSTAE